MTANAPEVLAATTDGICRITINRAAKANALTADMMAEIRAAIDGAAADPAARAVILTGAGERVFCAGVDVRTATALPAEEHARLRSLRLFEVLLAMIGCPKPVVAALNGAASGGGCMLAMMADFIVAADHAFLSLPEIDLDIPTFAGLAIVQHLGGSGLANDLVQTGRRMPATEARARGLVTAIAPATGLADEATRVAQMLAGKPQRSFALNKAWLVEPLRAALHRAEEASAAAKRNRKG